MEILCEHAAYYYLEFLSFLLFSDGSRDCHSRRTLSHSCVRTRESAGATAHPWLVESVLHLVTA